MDAKLPLPKRLLTLLDAGLWPRTDEEVGRQGLLGFVPAERVRLFAPHDNIHFYNPPFNTVAAKVAGG